MERADHPAGLPVFGIARPNPDAIVTDVETWSVRLSGWGPAVARSLDPSTEVIAVPDGAFDGAALLVSVPQGRIDVLAQLLVNAGASVRSKALVGSHARRYTVTAEGPPATVRPRTAPNMPSASEVMPCSSRSFVRMSVLERPQPRPGVLKIQAYVPGKSTAPGVAKVFKLSSNETPLGASPKAIAAYNAVGQHLRGLSGRRVDRAARSDRTSPTASIRSRIVCGAGSDDFSICSRAPTCRTATRRSTPRTAFWSIRS